MVIFLFLRSIAATIIPAVAVPLSIVGTFGVMYLLGYSLNNLSLMALTISTGFVVDDAIVMIENIDALSRDGRQIRLTAALKGSEQIGFTILSLDGFVDCGADSAAVHGRYCGSVVPGVCCNAGGYNSGFGGGVADADADDVGEAAEAYTRQRMQSAFYRKSEAVLRVCDREAYGRGCAVCAAPSDDYAAGDGLRLFMLTIFLYIVVPKGFFPVQDTGVLLGITEAPQTISFAMRWRARQTGAGAHHPAGSRCGERVLVYRHRRNEHDAEQRPDSDQPEGSRDAHRRAPLDVIQRLQPKVNGR